MNGGTTSAGTMYCASLAGIKVFATGGLGGVHRGVEETFDISADLVEISKTPVCVVSAGVKSILDIPKTLEYLETMGVPVVSYCSDYFPDFFTSSSGIKTEFRCDTPGEVAAMIASQDAIGLETGMILANPIPKDKEMNSELIRGAVDQALKESDEKGITGAKLTPFLLKRVNELTNGQSEASNIELIKNNAKIGAQIVVALSRLTGPKPVLGYWKIRGYAANLRYQLAYSGIDYDMVEYEQGEGPEFSNSAWLSVKHTLGFAFPNLPYLIDGDHKLTETQAIHKYLADKWDPNLLGKDPTHRARTDMLAGVIGDLNLGVRRPCYAGEKEKSLEAIQAKVPPLVQFMQGKFLTADEPVWLDFFFFELLELMAFLSQGQVFNDHPKLVSYHHNMANLPKLKEYLESDQCREKTYPFNNTHAKINNVTGIQDIVKAAYE